MVIVAHLVLDNSLLFPGSQLKCTLNLVNKSKEVVNERGSYNSNLVQIFYDESFREKKEKVVYYTAKPRDEDDSQVRYTKDILTIQVWIVEKVYGQVNGMCICDETHFGKIDSDIKYNDEGDSRLETLVPKKPNTLNIFTSHPKHFSDLDQLTMRVDDKKTVAFTVQLPPNEIPPSYKGATLRYIYFVNVSLRISNSKIGTHRLTINNVGTLTKVLRLPFKIYNPLASLVPILSSLPSQHDFEWRFERVSQPSNNFFYAFHEISKIINKNSTPSHYDISHNGHPVCRFSISTTAHYLGDNVIGLFDFTTKSPSITIDKLRTELIYEEQLHKTSGRALQTSVAYFINNVDHMTSTNFSMMIPPQCPAQFSTDLIDVKWYLRFMFNVREQDKSELMEWNLPIQVFVPSDFRPLHTQSHSRETCMLLYL